MALTPGHGGEETIPSAHDGSEGRGAGFHKESCQCLYITDMASAHCSGVW